jgi:polyhydroxyalkanoate synthase
MPAAMHSQYLRSCYLKNEIVQPGTFVIDQTPIDLRLIHTPLYILGAQSDHIAPWRSTYATIKNVSSEDLKYTLTNAGHIAGIVNPAGNPKAWFRTKPHASSSETADDWFAGTEQQTGSWWEDWAVWAQAHGGDMVAPYPLPPGENAPGRYVRNEEGAPIAVNAR